MAEQRNLQGGTSALSMELDIYSILRDVLKNLWVALALAAAAGLLTVVRADRNYHPTYTVEATYVVSARGVNNSVFNSLSTAKDTAALFAQIINSQTLMNKVAEELGTGVVQGRVTSEIVPETNLLTLKVTSDTPEMAFRILRSVMNNYPSLADYMVGNSVMDVLMAPVIPTQPDRPLSVKGPVLRSVLITALAAVAALAFFSWLKDTIRKPADVERKLDTHLLGTLCHERKKRSLLALVRKLKTSLLISNPTVSFRYVELTQKVCRRVRNRMEERNAKILLVTSCLENEGKSTVAANLALALAQNGERVVLMDLDLRKPSQYKIFDLYHETRTELGDFLSGDSPDSNMIGHLEDKGIYYIFNTKEYANSTELLTAGKLEQLLDYLRESFDYVILDTPPMAYVADTEEIAGMADASLVVVREHLVGAKQINDMLDALSVCRAVPIGCVFNDAHVDVSQTIFGGYGSGYGYGYGYGRYYGRYGRANRKGKPGGERA